MASTSNAYDFDLFDSRDHGSAAPKLPEPKAPQKQKQKNNVVKRHRCGGVQSGAAHGAHR